MFQLTLAVQKLGWTVFGGEFGSPAAELGGAPQASFRHYRSERRLFPEEAARGNAFANNESEL